MSNLQILYKFRFKSFVNQASQQLRTNKLKFIIISFSAIVLWVSIFVFFYRSFVFVNTFQEIGEIIRVYTIALFFFALGMMLIISNAIINYSSFFHSQETDYLISLPLSPSEIFFYKMTESLLFSSWAFLFLASPFLVAFGINRSAGWLYYLWIIFFPLVFIILPALIGSLFSIILARFLPRRRREILIALIFAIIIVVLFMLTQVASLKGSHFEFTTNWMKGFMDKLSFAQNPLLPSYWATMGLVNAADGNSDAVFFFLLLLSQGLFLGLIVYQSARIFYFKGYSLIRSSHYGRKYLRISIIERIVLNVLCFLRLPLRLIIIKDIKTFFRDPAQWTQILIFFGLLGVYFINIKNVPYINIKENLWQYLVSSLNLIATTLTLATFTTRFVYPQISLEGKRFWIIGMMPISRKDIFFSKFIMAFLGSIIITEPLIFISSWQLEVPYNTLLYQLYLVFNICLGLSAISVSLGILYPNFKEDNPSKIVSGFGGTLTLILSLFYILGIIVIGELPAHLYYVLNRIDSDVFLHTQVISFIVIFVISISTTFLLLNLGLKSIRRIEI
jgi:ABC-2 type transport system permease protein